MVDEIIMARAEYCNNMEYIGSMASTILLAKHTYTEYAVLSNLGRNFLLDQLVEIANCLQFQFT